MRNLRNIGYKIYLLTKQSADKELLCNTLNFSNKDYYRLITGRLSLTPKQLKTITELFSIEPAEILNYRNRDGYAKLVNYRKPYTQQDNCEEILDIIDTYIDFAEIKINT